MTVAGNPQAHPHGHDPYEPIREICAKQAFFDELEFGTLFDEEDGFLAIKGSVEVPTLEGEIAMTLWRGGREAEDPTGMPTPLWLKVEGSSKDGDEFKDTSPVDPDADDLGLTLPEFFRTPQMVGAGRVLLDLLLAAEPTDRGLTGAPRESNFELLEEAVQDGYDAADSWGDPDQETIDEDDSELALHTYCENSSLVSVSFELRMIAREEVFTTHAVLTTVAGDVPLAMWIGPENGSDSKRDLMLEVADRVQAMPDDAYNDELYLPWGPGIPREQVRMGLRYLRPIHMHAFTLYLRQLQHGTSPHEVCAALGAMATNALKEGDPLPLSVYLPSGAPLALPEGPEWHRAMDEFTAQCKLGLLAGVVVEESLHGNLNIRATTLDPVTRDYIELKVYWEEPADGSDPVHWLAAGEATNPAHGGDPAHPELLAGFPQQSKDHIRHGIDHLHEMVHLATDVVNGKAAEVAEVLAMAGMKGDVPDIVGGHMQAEAIEDALMGLNGIARLYTGSTDRDVRNS